MPAEVARDNKGDITTEFDDGVVGGEEEDQFMLGKLEWDMWEEEEEEVQPIEGLHHGGLNFWTLEDTNKATTSLNLNLNYQHVLDAWSDRGSLWATNDSFAVEVPVMEEEKKRRRDRVLRYREKRRSRLFFKRIRYQVRKLNAEQRPRSKGRFVKTIT
ncbi:Protein CHLOROPLAST IMPORT APPARATUS 2 [Acorus calamus]|uniref:Protein CHLOROPLAST IMPORT APPARATUS 2 n=1 Tax=Acorus calamus TaxID=4465 RepID=A0AAV9C8X0_ACOCL|nr:Protein CHLOROPLAST IMPORT APPARATUS 2 [Acorus calamus]